MFHELRAAKKETVLTELEAINAQCTTKRTKARFAAYVKNSKRALGRAARGKERLLERNRELVRQQRASESRLQEFDYLSARCDVLDVSSSPCLIVRDLCLLTR